MPIQKKLDLLKLHEASEKVFGTWVPAEYQKKMFTDIFINDKRYVFEEWSRGAGKTVAALKLAFLAAELYPGRAILYLCPTQKLGEDIINEKYHTEFPQHLLTRSVESRGHFRFKNGSDLFIRGAEGNVNIGKEPVLIIYDEFAYHNPKAHNTISPTLRNEGKLLIISTPPRIDDVENGKSNHYDKMVEFCKNHHQTSYRQVFCDEVVRCGVRTQDFIDFEEAQYTVRGEYDEFLGEYWLRRVRRSKDSYFKDIDRSILIPCGNMIKLIETIQRPTWVVIGDTSGSTRWGALFVCVDEINGKCYLIDSLVNKREGKNRTENRISSGMTPSEHWPQIQQRMQKWLPGSKEDAWRIIWDHDNLYIDIVPQLFGQHIHIEPTTKRHDEKSDLFSIMRDLIKTNRIYIGEDCSELIDEMQSLSVNPKTGKFNKVFDELLDCFRYLIMTFDTCFENHFKKEENKLDIWQDAVDKWSKSKKEQYRYYDDGLDNIPMGEIWS